MTTTTDEGLSREALALLRQARQLFRLGFYAAATVAAGAAVEQAVRPCYRLLREQYPDLPKIPAACYCVNRLRQRRWIDSRTHRRLIVLAKRRNRAAHCFQASPLGALGAVWVAEQLVADLGAMVPPAEPSVACLT